MLNIGDKAPDFLLEDHETKKYSLNNFKGKYIVLYFYPKDNTPGCTIEAVDFSSLKKEFEKKNSVILGISKDSCFSHKKFIKNKNLIITLLSDPEAQVQKAYDVWKPKKFLGKEFLGTIRTTFLINPKGEIKKIWNDVSVTNHAQEVLNEIKKLKLLSHKRE